MAVMEAALAPPVPVRALPTDDPAEILAFAAKSMRDGADAVLATLAGIRGGAARRLGSHMAVATDGRFCGYVSGGCVEAAVASEALLAMADGQDRMAVFGEGSPFFDIVLPCGGGIDVTLHRLRESGPIEQVLERLQARKPAGLVYSPQRQALHAVAPPGRAGWEGENFVTLYRPRTRLVISGETIEAQAVATLAEAAGYEIVTGVRDNPEALDAFTAVVMLHHDLDAEERLLETALSSPAFYIGALGSTRTHRRRVERLRAQGWRQSEIGRIKAPIGFFGPTRDSGALAVSVIADVSACRLAVYG